MGAPSSPDSRSYSGVGQWAKARGRSIANDAGLSLLERAVPRSGHALMYLVSAFQNPDTSVTALFIPTTKLLSVIAICGAMSLSDSSALSSPPSTDDEAAAKAVERPKGLNKYFKPAPKPQPTKEPPSPPAPKRETSPPHQYVFSDNADIAVSIALQKAHSA